MRPLTTVLSAYLVKHRDNFRFLPTHPPTPGFDPLEGTNLNHWPRVSSPPHLRKEVHPASETLRFSVFIIPDDGQSPERQ
jgi:hypothetical protein